MLTWTQDGEDLVLNVNDRQFGSRDQEVMRIDGVTGLITNSKNLKLPNGATVLGRFKRTVTVAHGVLTDADTSQTVNIGAVLPANARIVATDIRALTVFAGGTVSALVVDIGTSGDIDAIVDGADLLSAAVDGGPATMPKGIRPNKTFATAGAQLIATFVSTTDNLVNLTSGTVTIDVWYEIAA